MKTIELSDKNPIPFSQYCRDERSTIARRTGFPNSPKEFQFLSNPPTDVICHEGYIGYLAKAWANHYSVVVSPDMIWFTILNELTAAVAKQSTKYANLFTTTPAEKQAIVVLTGKPEEIDPASVINALKARVPSNVDDFIPKFSTTTPAVTLAMNVAFCDLVSPYYEYFTMMCGFPSIRIEGTEADWTLVLSKLQNLTGLFQDDLKVYLTRCISCVQALIDAVEKNDAEHFRKMAKVEHCGSGHQIYMDGWILQLFNGKEFSQRVRTERIPPHFANMTYTNLETQRKFKLYAGMFYSKIEGSFMIPCFDSVRYEILPEKKAIKETETFRIVSVPGGNQVKKLDAKWVAEEDQNIVYAPYIVKTKPLDIK